MICGFLYLTSVTGHNISEAHLCCSMNHSILLLNNISLYGYSTVCLSIHQLVDISVISSFGIYEKCYDQSCTSLCVETSEPLLIK